MRPEQFGLTIGKEEKSLFRENMCGNEERKNLKSDLRCILRGTIHGPIPLS